MNIPSPKLLCEYAASGLNEIDWRQGRNLYWKFRHRSGVRDYAIKAIGHYLFYGDQERGLKPLGYGCESARTELILKWYQDAYPELDDQYRQKHVERAVNWSNGNDRRVSQKSDNYVGHQIANDKTRRIKRTGIAEAVMKCHAEKLPVTQSRLSRMTGYHSSTIKHHSDIWQRYDQSSAPDLTQDARACVRVISEPKKKQAVVDFHWKDSKPFYRWMKLAHQMRLEYQATQGGYGPTDDREAEELRSQQFERENTDKSVLDLCSDSIDLLPAEFVYRENLAIRKSRLYARGLPHKKRWFLNKLLFTNIRSYAKIFVVHVRVNQMKISQQFVDKLTSLIDVGLCKGLGNPKPGEMCLQAAICYAKGAPHSDKPTCVDASLRSFGIGLNDANWSSDQIRAKCLRDFGVAQLGTAEKFDSVFFAEKMALYAVNKNVPLALRAALKISPFPEHKEKLEAAAVQCEKAITSAAASAASYAASAASDAASDASAAASYAASAAASYAASAASDAASDAASAAASAAASYAASAASAASAAASYAASAAASDQVLIDTVDYAVLVLIEMKTAGSKFLKNPGVTQ